MSIQGSCLCGTLKYEVDGPFTMMMSCHCSMCRKHHGAPFATFAAADLNDFRWLSGETAVRFYASSAEGKRSFCSVCGSVAPMLMKDMGLAMVPAGTLEADPGIRPAGAPVRGLESTVAHDFRFAAPAREISAEFGDAPSVSRPTVEAEPDKTLGSCLCGEVAYEMSGKPVAMYQCHCTAAASPAHPRMGRISSTSSTISAGRAAKRTSSTTSCRRRCVSARRSAGSAAVRRHECHWSVAWSWYRRGRSTPTRACGHWRTSSSDRKRRGSRSRTRFRSSRRCRLRCRNSRALLLRESRLRPLTDASGRERAQHTRRVTPSRRQPMFLTDRATGSHRFHAPNSRHHRKPQSQRHRRTTRRPRESPCHPACGATPATADRASLPLGLKIR